MTPWLGLDRLFFLLIRAFMRLCTRIRALPGDPAGFGAMRRTQREYIDRFLESEPLQQAAGRDPGRARLLAHCTHDAIAVAGGLSAPRLISRVLWLAHNGTGAAAKLGADPPLLLGDRRLGEPKRLRKLVLETARLTRRPVA